MYLHESFPNHSRAIGWASNELGQSDPYNPDNMPIDPLPPGNVPPASIPNVPDQRLQDQINDQLFTITVRRIRTLLEPPMRARDEHGIQLRKQRLLEAFRLVPSSHASALLFQLQYPHDLLGRLFRYKLATPTRRALLRILTAKARDQVI